MGRSGALLRARKDESVTYTFTKAQLREHDRQVANDAIESRKAELKRVVDENVKKVTEEYHEGDKIDVYKVLSYGLCLSCKVLIECFGWIPPKRSGSNQLKIIRFIKAIEQELDNIEQYSDLKTYCKAIRQRYDVGFITEERKAAENSTEGMI